MPFAARGAKSDGGQDLDICLPVSCNPQTFPRARSGRGAMTCSKFNTQRVDDSAGIIDTDIAILLRWREDACCLSTLICPASWTMFSP